MLIAILMAMSAYTFLSLGFVLQKKGIKWMGWKGKKNKIFYTNLATWITGFIIMNIYAIPSAISLKKLSAHIVSAFAGWGIIMLVFFSFLVLKEKLFLSDYLFSFLIVTGIVSLNLLETHSHTPSLNGEYFFPGMIILFSLPFILMLIGFLKNLSPRIKTWIFASVSGISAGLMVVTLKFLVNQLGYDVSLYIRSPYFYFYLIFALLSLIGLQLGLKNGPMIVVGPIQYSANIIYPVFAVLLIYQRYISIFQLFAIALIIIGVIYILKKH